MRDFMAALQHNLSPDFAALIRATVMFGYGYFRHCQAALPIPGLPGIALLKAEVGNCRLRVARDPAIHAAASSVRQFSMDRRVKPGGDDAATSLTNSRAGVRS